MSSPPLPIRPATAEDLPGVESLLASASLPTAGVRDLGDALLVAEAEGGLAACAGLEIYGAAGLLRSVATQPAWRGRGIAGALVERLLAIAADRGIRRIYLLTETAASFFPRFGFRRVERDEVDPAVRASAEFASLCPSSAVAMVRDAVRGS